MFPGKDQVFFGPGGREFFEVFQKIGMEGLARFDLQGQQAAILLFEDAVNLGAVAFAPVIERGAKSCVVLLFHQLADHQVLKQGSVEVVGPDHLRTADPEEGAGQSRVEKEKPGCLDNALAEVAVIGLEQEHHEAGLQQ